MDQHDHKLGIIPVKTSRAEKGTGDSMVESMGGFYVLGERWV